MLVNIVDQGDLDDPATLEALTPSHDAKSGQQEHMGKWWMMFRHFRIPKLPSCLKEVYRHEHEGSPVFVVAKMPRHQKLRPGKEDDGVRWLRTTWALRIGKWELESRDKEPGRSNSVINYWVDRAVFLFKEAGQVNASDRVKTGSPQTLALSQQADDTLGAPESLKFNKWVYKEAEGILVRYHHCPRRKLFQPTGATNCPVDFDRISQERTAHVQFVGGVRLYHRRVAGPE